MAPPSPASARSGRASGPPRHRPADPFGGSSSPWGPCPRGTARSAPAAARRGTSPRPCGRRTCVLRTFRGPRWSWSRRRSCPSGSRRGSRGTRAGDPRCAPPCGCAWGRRGCRWGPPRRRARRHARGAGPSAGAWRGAPGRRSARPRRARPRRGRRPARACPGTSAWRGTRRAGPWPRRRSAVGVLLFVGLAVLDRPVLLFGDVLVAYADLDLGLGRAVLGVLDELFLGHLEALGLAAAGFVDRVHRRVVGEVLLEVARGAPADVACLGGGGLGLLLGEGVVFVGHGLEPDIHQPGRRARAFTSASSAASPASSGSTSTRSSRRCALAPWVSPTQTAGTPRPRAALASVEEAFSSAGGRPAARRASRAARVGGAAGGGAPAGGGAVSPDPGSAPGGRGGW